MSSIVKLSISGIRSFENNRRETLTFSKPLTLICGPNGSGKTTVIESLRYVITGDLPPNSKGGAFVFDPKMAAEREVLAQVKLAFYNTAGQRMVVTRSIQVTVKRSVQTFKTLEGQLLVMDGDDRRTVSSRCADLDAQVPMFLGASPSVLNYVVFCHQEDSLWPLSEPGIVKKRFDEIFEATKFSKALENLKTIKKDYLNDVKVQEKTAQFLQVDVERALKLQTQAKELETKIEEYKKECFELQNQISNTTKKLNTLFDMNQSFQEVIQRLRQTRKALGDTKISINSLLADMTVIEKPEEDIVKQLESYNSLIVESNVKMGALRNESQVCMQRIDDIRKSQSQFQLELGKAEATAATVERQREDLDLLVSDFCKQFNVAASGIKEALREKLEYHSREADKLRNSNLQSEFTLQKQLAEATSEGLQVEQEIANIKDSLRSIEKKALALSSELEDQDAPIGLRVTNYEKELASRNSELESTRKKLDALKNSELFKSLQNKIEVLNSERDEAQNLLIQATERLQKEGDSMAVKNSLDRNESRKKILCAQLLPRYEKILGTFSFESFDVAYNDALKLNRSFLKQAQSNVNECTLKLKNSEMRCSMLEENFQQVQLQITRLQSEIQTHTSLDDFDSKLQSLQEDVEVATQNLEQASFSIRYFEMAKRVAHDSHKCVLCRHDMNEQELQNFAVAISQKLESVPLTKEDAEFTLQEVKNKVEAMRSLRPAVYKYHELQLEVEKLSNDLLEQRGHVKAETEAYSTAVSQLEKAINKTKNLEELHECIRELANVCHDVEDLKKKLDAFPEKTLGISPATAQEKVNSITKAIKEAKSEFQKLRDDEEKLRDAEYELQAKVMKLQVDLNTAMTLSQSYDEKRKRLEDLRVNEKKMQETLPMLKVRLEKANEAKISINRQIQECRHRAAVSEKKNAESQSQLQRALEKLVTAERNAAQSQAQLDARPVAILQEQIAACKTALLHEIESNGKIDDQLRKIELTLADIGKHKRNLQDNLTLHKLESEKKELEKQIQELTEQQAEREQHKYEQETLELQQLQSNLSSRHASRAGEIKQMQQQHKQLNASLCTEYKNVHSDYRKASVQLDVTQQIIRDLGKYTTALDSAIMQYHTTKLQEVNQVLDELWKATYKGSDVDTIFIKGDQEGSRGIRSYNYRVCMVKQNIELDMRGRCSAGQKVLAAVIIRLALAECFGLHCGLIVLDEPTTNLDRENVEALAKSLDHIIHVRRKQKNFQLIVITHDEHFLACMKPNEFCDYFFRLERDERQLSRIAKVPIGHLE